MDMQNVSNLIIPEGEVKVIHDSNNQLLWGRVNYDTKYAGDTLQNGTPTPDASIPIQVVTGEQTVSISDGINTQSYTISLGSTELCKIGIYQDYIYKSGDDWYVHKACGKILLDDNANVGDYIATQGDYFITQIVGNLWKHNSEFIADRFSYKPNWGTGYSYESIYYGGVSGEHMDFKLSSSRLASVTVANIKAWFGSNNTTVYYQLATPTDTKITDNTLISQLNAVHQWLVRYGYNATVSSNLPMIIDRNNL